MLAAFDPWILAFSLVTVAVTIWMGFRSAKTSKSASDFFVAGRSVSVGWNASAISGEYLSAASFMGVAGMVMSSGYDALWYPVCYACGYLFLLLFIAGPLRRFGAYTIPDFAEGRYDSPVFRKIAVIFVLFIGFFYTMPQMKGAGTTLAYIFPGLPYWVGVVLVGAVITLNVALGGMKGITLVQAFQYWAKMFAISVPIFVLMSVYGGYGKQVNVNGESRPAAADTVDTDFETIAANRTLVSQLQVLGQVPYAKNIHGLTAWLKELGQAPPRKNWRSLLPPTGTNVTWRASMPLQVYMAATGKHVLWQPSLDDLPPFTMNIARTAATTDDEFAALMAAGLRANGVAMVMTPKDAVIAVKATELQRTGNAPAATEATGKGRPNWSLRDTLNDPNPVTRAKPQWVLSLERLTKGSADQIKPDSKISYGTGAPGKPLSEVCLVIQHWAGLSHVLCETNLLTRPIVFNADRVQSPRELVTAMERALEQQGVSLIHASAKEWWAVPTAELAKYQLVDAVSRLPLPAKAPKDETWLNPFGPLTTKAAKAAKLDSQQAKPYALLYTYSLIIALVCGTAGLPHILVRFYTNPDGVAAKRTTMWVMILIGIFYVFPPVFGVMGRNLMPSLYEGTGAKGTDKVVLELPKVLDGRSGEIGKTGKQEDGKTGADGSVLFSSTPVFPSSPTPATGASGGIPWGSILSGITCAGAFAAFMSTFSGLLVSMTGALAHDVYGRMLRPNSTPAERMRMFKFCAVAVGTVAVVLGSFVEPLQINFMVGQAFAIAAASYFPLLFMSVWWRGMTMRGAAAGMLTGGVCALAAVTLTNFSDLKWIALGDFWAAHPLLRILCEQPAIWTVPLAIGLMVAVSKLTRATVPADVRMKMLVLHAPEKLGLKQEYIKEHEAHGH